MAAKPEGAGLKGDLKIIVHQAKSLKDVQAIGKQDPYCIINILGGQHKKMQTKVCTDGAKNPVWGNEYNIKLTGEESRLMIQIFNSNMASDEFICRSYFDIKELRGFTGEGKKIWIRLGRGANEKDYAGDLQLSFRFIDANPPPKPVAKPQPVPQPAAQKPVVYPNVTQQQPHVQPQVVHQMPPQGQPQVVYQQHPQQPQVVYQQRQPQVVYAQPTQQMYGQPQVVYQQQQPMGRGQPVGRGQPQVVYQQYPQQQPYGQPPPQYGRPQPQVVYRQAPQPYQGRRP